jgi:hypothetical protein
MSNTTIETLAREKRIPKEIEQMFKTADIVSIQNRDPKSIDVNDNNFMKIIITRIMEDIKKPRMEINGMVIDEPYELTVVCRQTDKNNIQKDVTYIFIIPIFYPFVAPIIKIDGLFDNTVLNVAGFVWTPSKTLLNIINGSQMKKLDSQSKSNEKLPEQMVKPAPRRTLFGIINGSQRIELDSQSKTNEKLPQQMVKPTPRRTLFGIINGSQMKKLDSESDSDDPKSGEELHNQLGGRQQTKKNRKNKRKINKRNKYNKSNKKNKKRC